MGQFFHNKSGSQEDNRPQFLFVLTYFVVTNDARTLEFCYPVDLYYQGSKSSDAESMGAAGSSLTASSHVDIVSRKTNTLYLYIAL